MMKVLNVIPATPGEGSGMIFAKRQVASVGSAGVDVVTFYLTSRVSVSSLWREWQQLREEISKTKPDLIHAHYGTMTAFLCAFGTGLPLVITYRGSDLNPTPNVSWLRSVWGRALSQLAALRASKIICVSEGLKDRLLWRRSRVSIIPSGVNLALFFPRNRDEARAALGWSATEKVVLFNAGAASRIKRLDLATAAFEYASQRQPNLRFQVLNGTTNPDQVPVYLSAADCLLFTSDNEGSPNIIKEALACNLPIVTVPVGDVAVRVVGVEPTRIVARDPRLLGEAVLELLALDGRSNGYEMVQIIGEEKLAHEIRALYEAAVQSTPFESNLSLQRDVR
ncbi:MAG TPA: glycosyltransferase [Pyrinomonadaceae bacterium]|nr:glycosyltransferase [Pyrinomonadaceae bacterium]